MVWFIRGRWLIRKWLVKRWLESISKRLGKLGFYTVLIIGSDNVAYGNDKISSTE